MGTKLTIWDQDGDQERRDKLFDLLEARGVYLTNKRGQRNISELFRALVQEKIMELEGEGE